jgi:HEPN domain-containing protein
MARNDLAMADCAYQAVEKTRKVLQIHLDQEPTRTHSLERLVEAAAVAGVERDGFQGRLNVLSRMASATRYPDGNEDTRDFFDAQDAEQALATADSALRDTWAMQEQVR